MRNDALDELDTVPSLTTDRRDRDALDQEPDRRAAAAQRGRGTAPAVSKSAGTGPLWALVGALIIAFGGLAWWSAQQLSMMEQSLVATQESFARISEEAAGRLQDISGKVVATESSVTSGSEALKLKVKQLETQVAELSKKQQGLISQQAAQQSTLLAAQEKRLEQLAASLQSQQEAQQRESAKLGEQVKGLVTEQGALGGLQGQLKTLSVAVEALKKQGNPSTAIARLEQDLLVLRSELDNRPAASGNTAEFDAFRAQMTRNISTLQAQVQNLQQQLNTR
ncbi:MAG: ATPase [Pseudomonadota bacterium]